MVALQNRPLPEAAEIQDILQQIEFDGLFYTHDRLAERQVNKENIDLNPIKSFSVCVKHIS